MTEPGASEMTQYGETFAEALERFLDHIASLAFNPDRSAETRSARFQCEAATLPDLARNAFEAAMALAADHELAITHVFVDGHRPIEGGHRCWGTVELAAMMANSEPPTIIDGPHVSRDDPDGRWRIDIWLHAI